MASLKGTSISNDPKCIADTGHNKYSLRSYMGSHNSLSASLVLILWLGLDLANWQRGNLHAECQK